jgi:hypothetical protein
MGVYVYFDGLLCRRHTKSFWVINGEWTLYDKGDVYEVEKTMQCIPKAELPILWEGDKLPSEEGYNEDIRLIKQLLNNGLCYYCNDTGEFETDNNGPVLLCPVCQKVP